GGGWAEPADRSGTRRPTSGSPAIPSPTPSSPAKSGPGATWTRSRFPRSRRSPTKPRRSTTRRPEGSPRAASSVPRKGLALAERHAGDQDHPHHDEGDDGQVLDRQLPGEEGFARRFVESASQDSRTGVHQGRQEDEDPQAREEHRRMSFEEMQEAAARVGS